MKKSTKKKIVRKKIERKTLYVVSKEREKFILFNNTITICIVFLGILLTTIGYAKLMEANSLVLSINKDLGNLKDNIQLLQIEISQKYSLSEIEEVAKKKLGMVKPARHQIKYVDVEKINTVVQNSTLSTVENKNIFKKFISWIKELG